MKNRKIFLMETVHDKDLKLLYAQITSELSNTSKLVFRAGRYTVVSNGNQLYVWYVCQRTYRMDDDSPIRGETLDIEFASMQWEDLLVQIPHVMVGPEVMSSDRKHVYRSVVLSLCRSSGPIVSFDAVQRSRTAFTVLTTDGSLTVFTDSPVSEESPFPEVTCIFHVELHLRLCQMNTPFSVCFFGLASIFVFDSSSDRVCEIKFDNSIVSDERTCPEISIVYWTLESRVCIDSTSVVSLIDANFPPLVQIINKTNNGLSLGLVKLLNARISTFFTRALNPQIFIHCCMNLLVVNSVSLFRILSTDDFDFPMFVRPCVEKFRLLASHIVLLNNWVVQVFTFPEMTPVCVYEGVEDFQVALMGILYLKRESKWEVSSFMNEKLGPSYVPGDNHSMPMSGFAHFYNGLHSMPISSEDWYVEIDGNDLLFCMNISDSVPRFVETVATNNFLVREQLSFTRVFGHLILCGVPGGIVCVKRHLRNEGIVWTPVCVCDGSLFVMTFSSLNRCMYLLNKQNGQVVSRPIPLELIEIFDEPCVIDLQDDFSIFHELCLIPENTVNDELLRCSDFSARRFLHSWKMKQTTTEAIAWAALSEFPEWILSQIGWASWADLQAIGFGYWCTSLTLIRTVSETLLKFNLQKYLSTKDPIILETRVSVWLAILGRQNLLASLYKQHGSGCASALHLKVANFLSTDFSILEKRQIGVRNAFELLKQKRYEFAIAVFLLCGAVEEAVDICACRLGDWQLALVILKMTGSNPDYFWEQRILFECPDIWLKSVWNPNWQQLVTQLPTHPNAPTNTYLNIPIRAPRISQPAFLQLANYAMNKRKNLAPKFEPWIIDDEQHAWVLHQMGLTPLANKLFPSLKLAPGLAWAMHNSI